MLMEEEKLSLYLSKLKYTPFGHESAMRSLRLRIGTND